MVKVALQEFNSAFYAKVAVLCFGVGAGIETFMVKTGFYDMYAAPHLCIPPRTAVVPGGHTRPMPWVECPVLAAPERLQCVDWPNPSGYVVVQRDALGNGAAAGEPGVQERVRPDEGCSAHELAWEGAEEVEAVSPTVRITQPFIWSGQRPLRAGLQRALLATEPSAAWRMCRRR